MNFVGGRPEIITFFGFYNMAGYPVFWRHMVVAVGGRFGNGGLSVVLAVYDWDPENFYSSK